VFTGADVLMPPTTFETVATKFNRDRLLIGTYCPTVPYDGALWSRIEFTAWYALTTLIYWITREANASTAFFAVRKEAFFTTNGFDNMTHADSELSRRLSKTSKIRPTLDMVVFVSARRTKHGIYSFNRHHLAMLVDVALRPMRKSRWLLREKNERMKIHSRST
jgi:GT2 family glycosyltransferase